MKQITTALLLAAMLTAALASCGGDTPAASTETKADTAPVAEAVTEAPRITADLPAKDFGGEEFTFYGRIYDNVWSASDLYSHEEDGEQINDAIYARTMYIEDTYNVKLGAIEIGKETVTGDLKTLITAGTSLQTILQKLWKLLLTQLTFSLSMLLNISKNPMKLKTSLFGPLMLNLSMLTMHS